MSAQFEAICYILNTKNVDFMLQYGEEFYSIYTTTKTGKIVLDETNCYVNEYRIIRKHYDEYGNIIDKTSFLSSLVTENTLFRTFIDTTSPAAYYGAQLEDEYVVNNAAFTINSNTKLFATNATVAYNNIGKNHAEVIATINKAHETADPPLSKRIVTYRNRWMDKHTAATPTYYSTGLTSLDSTIGNISASEELITIVARSNVGKTWWMLFMAHSIWSQGKNIGFYSPEMSIGTIEDRIMCLESHIAMNDLSNPKDSATDHTTELDAAVSRLTDKFAKADFDVRCDTSMSVAELKTWARNKKLNALFIDGVSYLTDDDSDYTTPSWQVAGNITRKLMTMSVELNIPVIIVVQANREAAKKQSDDDEFVMPTLATLANSDQIAQHSTKVIAIGRNGNKHRVQTIKNRTGVVDVYADFEVDFAHGEFKSVVQFDNDDEYGF